MRMKLIHELSEIWRQAENSLSDYDDKKAIRLKDKFTNKCKNLKEDELEELSKILDGDAC